MKYDIIVTDNPVLPLRYHKFGKKCVGRFFTTHNSMESIETDSITFVTGRYDRGDKKEVVVDFRKLKHYMQSSLINRFCQKCCGYIIEVLFDNCDPVAAKEARLWFDSQWRKRNQHFK